MFNADPIHQENIRYQTIENKRTALYKALLQRPDDNQLKAKLSELASPQQIRVAAKDGIFVNYARSDEVFALDMTMMLQNTGQRVWLDVLNINNADWRREVTVALDHTGLMVTIVSRQSLNDRDSLRERIYFMKQGKIILPILYDEHLDNLPPYLISPTLGFEKKRGIQMLLQLLSSSDTGEFNTVSSY